jgi:regulator of sigma E protease
MPAEAAGLETGDVLLAVNGVRNLDQPAIIAEIKKHPGAQMVFRVERAGRELDVPVVPTSGGQIGVRIFAGEFRRIDPTVGQALAMSATQNVEMAGAIGRTLRDLVTREAEMDQLMGPLGIADMTGTAAQIGWTEIFRLMAMLSLNLGLLNLLPIPVLDGGHIAILAAEGLARRDFSVRIKERMLLAGAALIVLLMVTVIYNDVLRLFR